MALDLHRDEPWTYEDYLTLPDDGNRYEVIDGKLYVIPAPSLFHQLVISRLLRWLFELQDAGFGYALTAPLDVVMGGCTPVQPDILFFAREHRAHMQARFATGATLLVEVLSPSTRRRDQTLKLEKYTQNRIPHCWIADPEASTLQILAHDGQGYRVLATLGRGDRFRWSAYPQFELDLDRLFEPLPD